MTENGHIIASGGSIRTGSPLPLGTQESEGGINFSIFSRHATRVCLELFDHAEDTVPSRVIDLNDTGNLTGDVWHVWVGGLRSGQLCAYRMDGPYAPSEGHRFNFKRLLLDPIATAISKIPPWDFAKACGYDQSNSQRDLAISSVDNASSMPKCVFIQDNFDWAGEKPPQRSWSKTVIYELHVRGFTIDPTSCVKHPGTYAGLIEKIPYLKALGVTAIELVPVQEFNHESIQSRKPQTGEKLSNYWGYDPVAFFALKSSYSSDQGLGLQKMEFKKNDSGISPGENRSYSGCSV